MGLFGINNEEASRAEDLARSYVELKKLYAGKHLLAMIDRFIDQAINDEDSMNVRDLTSNEVAFYRGIRHGLLRVKKDIDIALHGAS